MKQNFGLDGLSADFTIGNCKLVPKCKISFVFIAKKGLVQDFLDFKNPVGPLLIESAIFWFLFKTHLFKVE